MITILALIRVHVSKFVMLGLWCLQMEHDSRPNCKYLSEYFGLLLEFARMGENECVFLLSISAISTMVSFFMAHKQQDNYVRTFLSAFLLGTLFELNF